MRSRLRSLITGLAAVGLLAVLVAGLPVVLLRFGGSPLPSRLPEWHRITAMLSSQDEGAIVLAVIRDCSWLAWLLFTVCVAAEAQAVIRGRRSPSLRLGGLQGVASQLVALAALAFVTPTAVTLAAATSPASSQLIGPQSQLQPRLQPEAQTQLHTQARPQPRFLPSPAAGRESAQAVAAQHASPHAGDLLSFDSAPAVSSRLIVVQPGDCLWLIAQHYLGAGDRYPEIAQLNYGHDMGDGQVFRDAAFIEPGWRLLVPGAPAADQSAYSTPAGGSASSGHPADRGGRLHHRGVHHAGHSTADHHYRAGHPTAAGSAAAQAAPAGQAATANASNQTGQNGETVAAQSALPDIAIFGAGLLAGAVLATLARLRRRQRQERGRGRRIALSADRQVLAAEQRLRAAAPRLAGPAADGEGMDPAFPRTSLQAALACLEAGISTSLVLPEIVALHVTPDVLELLLAAPAADAPPEPFTITPGRQGMCWQLGLSGPDRWTGSGDPFPACHMLPGLLTAGTTSDGYLLIDLESLGVTGCDGPPELVDRVLTTAATELVTAQWSGWYDLILVGFDELAVLGRADTCPTIDEALGVLAARARVAEARLAERDAPDLRQLRLTEPEDEDWGLTILISRTEPTPAQTEELLRLAEDGPGGIAALVAGDPQAPDARMPPAVLQLAPDSVVPGGIIANIVPLQLAVRPRMFAAADYEAITTLFTIADDMADVSRDAEPYAVYGAPPWIPQAATLSPPGPAEDLGVAQYDGADFDEAQLDDDADDGDGLGPGDTRGVPGTAMRGGPGGAVAGEPEPGPRGGLLVRVLGPFAVTGSADQLQPKQAELLLALALAVPAGLSNSALRTMLGADPDHPKPSDAVRQIITRTRRRLGLATDGREYIIHAGNGHYVLHPDVALDWTEFRALADSGRAGDLRQAVALIGGTPFAGSYYWWIDVPLIETVRAELTDAADMLAEFELTIGSPRASARAARAGLRADPSAEQLWRAVMRAEHAAGNTAAVTEAWRGCLDAIEDVAPGGEPHPETVRLFRELTAGAMPPGARSVRQQAPVNP